MIIRRRQSRLFTPTYAACLGAETRYVRTTEHMEECRCCGTEVQFQLVDHRFFGFKAGCERYAQRDGDSK